MNQELSRYLQSSEFRNFCDVDLYTMACNAAKRIIDTMQTEGLKPAKRAQIQSITSIVQAFQMEGLLELAKSQKDKNSKKENKQFWTLIYQHIEDLNDQNSLRPFVRRFLSERHIVREEKQLESKAEQSRQKTLNNEAIWALLNAITPDYIEHFTSHYYYLTLGVQHG